jgi:transcriptional regulator with XRE-family HTH domain
MKCQNMIGPQVRRLRYQRAWSQETLAGKLQLLGWDIGRVGLAKIESRLVHVEEYELLFFARVFNVCLDDLFPTIDTRRQMREVVAELMHRRTYSEASPKKMIAAGKIARAPRRWSD